MTRVFAFGCGPGPSWVVVFLLVGAAPVQAELCYCFRVRFGIKLHWVFAFWVRPGSKLNCVFAFGCGVGSKLNCVFAFGWCPGSRWIVFLLLGAVQVPVELCACSWAKLKANWCFMNIMNVNYMFHVTYMIDMVNIFNIICIMIKRIIASITSIDMINTTNIICIMINRISSI